MFRVFFSDAFSIRSFEELIFCVSSLSRSLGSSNIFLVYECDCANWRISIKRHDTNFPKLFQLVIRSETQKKEKGWKMVLGSSRLKLLVSKHYCEVENRRANWSSLFFSAHFCCWRRQNSESVIVFLLLIVSQFKHEFLRCVFLRCQKNVITRLGHARTRFQRTDFFSRELWRHIEESINRKDEKIIDWSLTRETSKSSIRERQK